jgi:Protein of unknown function (DUF3034)
VRGWQKRLPATLALTLCGALATMLAPGARAGDRLPWTGGVSTVEGVAGGGLVPWALIAGLGTEDQTGGAAFVGGAHTSRFELRAAGVAVGIDDRVELSYARQRFDVGQVVPGVTLGQDVAGVKVKLLGDAVFDQDRWWPQLAAGVLHKQTKDFDGVPHALGASSGEGTEFYLAATKLWLGGLAGRNVLFDVTLRRSDANQYGLLGFGGNRSPAWRPEASAAVWLGDEFLLGAEYRGKRAAFDAPSESSASDVFLAWEPWRHFTVVLAYIDLGPIAFQPPQRGTYLSFTLSL